MSLCSYLRGHFVCLFNQTVLVDACQFEKKYENDLFKCAILLFYYCYPAQPVDAPDDSPKTSTYSEVKGQDIVAKANGKDAFEYHPTTYDTAYFYVRNNLNEKIHVWGQSNECYKVISCYAIKLNELYLTEIPIKIERKVPDNSHFSDIIIKYKGS